MHYIEIIILTSVSIVCFIAIWFIPRKKAAEATFIFLVTRFFTWILGLFAVEFAWLDYPVHELSKANSTSFIFEYFLLPVITIFFVLHYPSNKSIRLRILYYATFSLSFTLIEYFLEKYTLVIKYHSWKWYWTWISLLLVLYIVMVIYKWFYKVRKLLSI